MRIFENRKTMSKEMFYTHLLVLAAWCAYPLLNYTHVLLSKISEPLSVVFIPSLFSILILQSVNYWKKTLKGRDFMFVCFLITVFFYYDLFFPQNAEYLDEISSQFVFQAVPMYFVGLLVNYETMKRDMCLLSKISLCAILFFYFVFLRYFHSSDVDNTLEDMMGAAYHALPHVLMIIGSAIRNHFKMSDTVFAIIGVVLLLIFGNRGAVLCAMAFTILCCLKYVQNKKTIAVLFFLGVFLYLNIDIIFDALYGLSEDLGMSVRFFVRMKEGTIADDNGREELYRPIAEIINNGNLLGYGMAGDRILLNGIYVHNIFLEMLVSYGVFGGPIIILLLLGLIIRSLIRCRLNVDFEFLVLLLCPGFIKLILSWSYIAEPFFYFLIGYCVNIIRKHKLMCY